MPALFKQDGFYLGAWSDRQRQTKDSMSLERKQRLDNIGFIWDLRAATWEEGFSKLVRYKAANGHCIVPKAFKLNEFKLGQWVSVQRQKKDIMPPERKQRLSDIGFVWDHLAEAWEEGFSNLLKFKESEGHLRVTQGSEIDGFKLGSWVARQRRTKASMSPERKQRLDDIGFVWDASKDKP